MHINQDIILNVLHYIYCCWYNWQDSKWSSRLEWKSIVIDRHWIFICKYITYSFIFYSKHIICNNIVTERLYYHIIYLVYQLSWPFWCNKCDGPFGVNNCHSHFGVTTIMAILVYQLSRPFWCNKCHGPFGVPTIMVLLVDQRSYSFWCTNCFGVPTVIALLMC